MHILFARFHVVRIRSDLCVKLLNSVKTFEAMEGLCDRYSNKSGSGDKRMDGMRENESVVDLKAARKRFSRIGWMYVIGTIVINVAQYGVVYAVSYLRPEWLQNGNLYLLLSMLPMYLIGIPILILLMKMIPADPPVRRSMRAGEFVVSGIMCYSMMYIANIIGNILTTVIGMFKGGQVNNQLLDVASSIDIWMSLLFMVICAPLVEEYVFRKLIVDRTIRYGQGVAIVTSGLMFGLFHGNLNQFIYAFVLGMFLAFLYVKTGNLKITIALHMIVNFLGGVVSTLIMKLIDLDEYVRILENGMDQDILMTYVMEHLAGWIVFIVYFVFLVGVSIAGFVLLIVCFAQKKFKLEKSEDVIPKGKGFLTAFLNVGMLVYTILWVGIIIFQLLQ